jgi:gliding motility-associated-like protein
MKKILLSLILALGTGTAGAQHTVRGGASTPLLAEDNQTSRIQVYLLNGLAGAEISFRTEKEEEHRWFKYDTRYSEAVPVDSRREGNNTSVVGPVEDGWAYFVESPSTPTPSFVWITDYSRYAPQIASLAVEEEDDRCEFLKLTAHIDERPIYYRTYQGATMELPRTYRLTYTNWEWNPSAETFVAKEETVPQAGPVTEMVVPAPLGDTQFSLSGDDYARHFGMDQRATTGAYRAIGLEVHARMTARPPTGDTETLEAGARVAYSAPVEVLFEARGNEPVAALYVWNILKTDVETGEQTSIIRYTDRTVSYTFRESGQYKAVVEVVDALSACSDRSQEFTITIDASELRLPNAFSPGSSPGVNDEYRVAHKSIVRFRASIYNRWGNLLYHWEDPDRGWDGKVNGRYVPTGVYYIVVEATGADGKTYNRSKDINVLRENR